jgi:MFS transporter, DHA1 family, multidrug resistance protein
LLLGALTAYGALSIDMYLPALATIGRELAAPPAATQATLALFFFGFAAGQLVYGPLSDRCGRRGPLLAGLALYVLASIACALAASISLLATARLAQALGACAGVVIGRAAVRDLYDVVEAAKVFSRLILIVGLAPILAPLIGAQLLLVASWRAIFVLLASFGALSMVAVVAWLPETHTGPRVSVHPGAVARSFAAILCDAGFLWPGLTAAAGVASLLTYVLGAPAVLIDHYGATPQQFSLYFGLNAIGLISGAQLNARWLRSRTPRWVLRRAAAVLLIAGAAVAYAAWSERGGLPGIAAAWFCLLTTLGFVTANASACALAGQGARAGAAAALLGALQFGAAALAGAAVGTLSTLAAVAAPIRAVGKVIVACTAVTFVASRVATRLSGRGALASAGAD